MARDLESILVGLVTRIAELERKQDNTVQQGTVQEVDPKSGTVRLRIGGTDDKPFLSPPIPYSQSMGALKVHSPPSKGQQMTAINKAGDFKQGIAMSMTQSDNNKSPSEKGDENVITFGDAKIELRGGELVVTVPKVKLVCGGSTFELTGGGLKMVAADYDFQ